MEVTPTGVWTAYDRIRAPVGSYNGSRDDLAVDPFAERFDLHGMADVGAIGGNVRVGDRPTDAVSVATARHAPDDVAVDPNRFGSECDDEGVGEHDRAQSPVDARRFRRDERVPADEGRRLVEPNREAETRFVRVVFGGHVGAPDPVALLDAQRVDRAVAAADDPVRGAGFPDRVPEGQPVFGGAVELPSELADVGDAHRDHRHGTHAQPLGTQVGERVVAEVGIGE